MTENKRYEIVFLNGLDKLCSIQDTEAEIPTFYNDLGHISTIKPVCDLLNEKEKIINKLKETIIKITLSYHQKHDNTIVNLVDEVYEEDVGDLFLELNYGDIDD